MFRTIVEESPSNIAVMDVFSKLIQERIIFIDDVVDSELANGVIAQLFYLDSISTDPMKIYINTPGGEVNQGLAIYDTSKLISSPIETIGMGCVASMGAILMLMGQVRKSLENTRFMLHQVQAGAIGTLSSVEVAIEEGRLLQKILYRILKEKTSIKDPENTLKEDKWMGAKEAKEIELITDIL
ncbi:MAG: ATP-dependent Clp protease proteolytic subunit [Candidatus Woesearchaeota archaeon]|jgi:ATP-dependent Clp protease protease subunit|nr:ATP-dependent Clp protease proteolytic subunit [Candidatus Woesearchaeota archaeon]